MPLEFIGTELVILTLIGAILVATSALVETGSTVSCRERRRGVILTLADMVEKVQSEVAEGSA